MIFASFEISFPHPHVKARGSTLHTEYDSVKKSKASYKVI